MDPHRVLRFEEPAIGLRAVLVLDSVVLGPAAGGIRCARYPSLDEAEVEARALARAMTLKCSLAGLDAGGGKAVIMEQSDWDRAAVFRRFGEIVEELRGSFRTAGDLGTTREDLLAMASVCQFVHTEEPALAASVARGQRVCLEALQAHKEVATRPSLLVQGCGAIGSAVARELCAAGYSLRLADIDSTRALALAGECAATAVPAEGCLRESVGVLAPCALGGVLSTNLIPELTAWGICGAANNLLAGDDIAQDQVAEALRARDIAIVPDPISSAGAVIDGIGDTVMELRHEQRMELIDQLGATCGIVLAQARELGKNPYRVARERAMARIERR